jgi:hypothetical protein
VEGANVQEKRRNEKKRKEKEKERKGRIKLLTP